ncbi:MAG: HD domain-containing protein [Nitrosomonadales bacterium]|nr:HD domain-containing protein [Nitrosomonadales bacterium]
MNYTNSAGKLDDRLAQLDPTGEVYLDDPAAVESAIRSILDPLYSSGYDVSLLSNAIRDLVNAYRGSYPGLLSSDTLYHDLRHALETGLTAARLFDGYAKSLAPDSPEHFNGDHALLAVLLALFHDIGLLRRETESHLFGAALTPVHEERGVEFMRQYLSRTKLAHLAEKSELIMATKLVFSMPHTWSIPDRKLAGMVASADLLSQFSDRCYLEKCRDFLFVEFSAFGLAGKTDSPYPDKETLLAMTPGFVSKILHQRLEDEFAGEYHLIKLHTGGPNPWEEAIQRNQSFLENILSTHDFARLRRQPKIFK